MWNQRRGSVVSESWHIPRALSDEALRLITTLPMEEIERRLAGWLPINTAPRDETEILASDYDAIEIVYWVEGWVRPGWSDREGRQMFPSWWQPLPEHPSLPEVEHD